MANNTIQTYNDYAKKIGNRKALYKAVAQHFNIKSVLYPGSHIDIAPSLVISDVVYVDNFKGSIKFFKDIEVINDFLEENKEYKEAVKIQFIDQDYSLPLKVSEKDLIISQFAGFVGQHTKQYLKIGGVLLCNDSHGDASLARFDSDFELIATINSGNIIDSNNLEEYFVLPKNKKVDLDLIKDKMKGLRYRKVANNYIFRKVK